MYRHQTVPIDYSDNESNTKVIGGIPFDFTIYDNEVLSCNIVFVTGELEETYRYYGDTWDDVLERLLNYYELKKALDTDDTKCHVKAVWFEKVEQRK